MGSQDLRFLGLCRLFMSVLGRLVSLRGMIESRGRVLLGGLMIALGVVFGCGPMALGSSLMMLRGGDMCIFRRVIDSFNSSSESTNKRGRPVGEREGTLDPSRPRHTFISPPAREGPTNRRLKPLSQREVSGNSPKPRCKGCT